MKIYIAIKLYLLSMIKNDENKVIEWNELISKNNSLVEKTSLNIINDFIMKISRINK